MTKLKLLFLIIFTTTTISLKNLLWTTLLLTLVLIVSTMIPNKQKIKGRILPLLTIGVFIILFQVFFNTSVIQSQRIKLGVMTAEKIIALSMLVFLFTETTSISKIVEVFSFLPEKLQLMLTITFSLIPAIMEESRKIILIQSSRGQNFKSLSLYKSIIPIIIPLLHRTLNRAEQIAIVIKTRGYQNE